MRPKLVYKMTNKQARAILDYFSNGKVNSLRKLAPILETSVQGADDIAYRVLGQWFREGKIKPREDFLEELFN